MPKKVEKKKRGRKPKKPSTVRKPKSSYEKVSRLLGMKDVLIDDYKNLLPIIKKIEDTAKLYSFDKIETPIMEDFSLYKNLLDKNKRNILYEIDQAGKERAILRPDLIHGMIRAFVESGKINDLDRPLKSFSMGPVFRKEKLRGGVYRQFNQFNFNIINDPKATSDAFFIYLIYNIFKELQIDIQVQVNSLGDFDCQKEFLAKFSKFIKERGRRSGLCNNCKKNILKSPALLLDCQEEGCLETRNGMPQIVEFLSEESNSRFYKTMDFLDKLNINYNFNPYLTRDLNYYNDLIFEIWPLGQKGELNPKLVLGRGGRYDEAFIRLSGNNIPLLGFSGGLERTLIKAKEKKIEFNSGKDGIFLAQIDSQAKTEAIFLFKSLFNKGFNVKQAFHLDPLKFQIEEAKKLNSRIILILGRKELAEDTILFRDVESGVQEVIARKDLFSKIEKTLDSDRLENEKII
jgi:histidyl-tRNA synthetase